MKKIKLSLAVIVSVCVLTTGCKKKETTPEPEPATTTGTGGANTSISFSKVTTTGTHFDSLFDHQSVVFNNKLWVLGGRKGNVSRKEVWSSADGVTWTQEVNTLPGAYFSNRHGHQALVFNNEIWVIGGTANNMVFNDVYSSSDGANWVQKTSSAPFSQRFNHRAFVFNNKLFVIGGHSTPGTLLYDVWSSTDGINWVDETRIAKITARAGHQLDILNNKLYLSGGYGASGFLNDVWSSTDGMSWTQEDTTTQRFSKRYAHQMITHNNNLYVIGGQHGAWGTTNQEIWTSSNGLNWTQKTVSGLGFGERAGHQAIVFNSKLYIIGGYDSQGIAKNDIWILN